MLKICELLKQNYGIEVIKIEERPGGWSAKAFYIQTKYNDYFLKVYDKILVTSQSWIEYMDIYMPVLIDLSKNNLLKDKIVCPVLTKDNLYKIENEEVVCLLFEYVDGITIGKNKLTNQQIDELAYIMATLHQIKVDSNTINQLLYEDLSLPFNTHLENFYKEKHNQKLDEFMKPYQDLIETTIFKTNELCKKHRKNATNLVLCHTDVHPFNLMYSDHLILIDWEGLKIAPKEADLFAFKMNDYYEKFMECYQKYYPEFKMDNDMLQFYLLRRQLEDISEFILRLCYESPSKESEKSIYFHMQESIDWLKS